MDAESQALLARLIQTQPTAALGTIFRDGPNVSQVLVALSAEANTFYIHISNLARHTRAIVENPRVSLMVSEPFDPARDPQTLARVTLQGEARLIRASAEVYPAARAAYLARFPRSEFNFSLGGFDLYGIEVEGGRFVAGFAKTFNLTQATFVEAVQSA